MVKWKTDASTGQVVRAGAIEEQQSVALADWRDHPLCAGVEAWMCVPRPMPVLACCFLPTPAPFPSLYEFCQQKLVRAMEDGRPHFQQRVHALEVGRSELEPIVSMLDALIRHHGRCIDGFHVESAPILANSVAKDDGGLSQSLLSSWQVHSLKRDEATARAREARANVAAARIAERRARTVARDLGQHQLSTSQVLHQAQIASAAEVEDDGSAVEKDMAFAAPHLFVLGCGTESDSDEEAVHDAQNCMPTEDLVAKALSRHERRLHTAAARRSCSCEVNAAVLTLCERMPSRAVILMGHVYCRRLLCERRYLLARCLARLEMLDGHAVEALQHRRRRRLCRRRRWSQHGGTPGGIKEQDKGRTLGILDSKELRMPAVDIVLDAITFLQRVLRGNRARKYARYVRMRRDRRHRARILFGMLCRIWASRKCRDRFRDAIDILRRCRRIIPLGLIRSATRRAARRRIVARRWKTALAWAKRAGKRERVAKRWRAAHFLQRVARGTIARSHVQHRRTMAESAKAAEEQRLQELRIENARHAMRALRVAQLLNPSAKRYLRKKRAAMDALQTDTVSEQRVECEPLHPALRPLLVRLHRALDGEDALQQAAKDEHRLASDDALLAESRDAAVEGQGIVAAHISRICKMRMAVFASPRACDIFGPAEQAFIRDLAALYDDAHTAVARAPPPTVDIVTAAHLRARSRPVIKASSLTEKLTHGLGSGLELLLNVATQLPTRLLLLLLPPQLTMHAAKSNIDETSGISDEVSTKIAVLRALRTSQLEALARALLVSNNIGDDTQSTNDAQSTCGGVQHYEEIARRLGRWEPRRRVIRCLSECCRVKIPTASQMPESNVTAKRNARIFSSELSLFHFALRVNTDLWLADTQVDIAEEAMVAEQFARQCVKEDAIYGGQFSAKRDIAVATGDNIDRLKTARSENIVRQRIAASNIHRPGSAVTHMSELHKRLRAFPRIPRWVAKHEAEIGTTLPALTGDADRIGDLRKVTQSVRAGEVRKAVEWRLLCRRFGFGIGPPGFEHPPMPQLRGGAGTIIAQNRPRQKTAPNPDLAQSSTGSKSRAPASAGRSRKLQMLPLMRRDSVKAFSGCPSTCRAAAAAKSQPCFSFIRTRDLCPNCLGWKQPHPSTGACLRCGSRSGPGPQSDLLGDPDSAVPQMKDSCADGCTVSTQSPNAGPAAMHYANKSEHVCCAPRARSTHDDSNILQDAMATYQLVGSVHDHQIDKFKARANKDLERQVEVVSMFMGTSASATSRAASTYNDPMLDRRVQKSRNNNNDYERRSYSQSAATRSAPPGGTKENVAAGVDVSRFRDGLLFDSFIAHCTFRHFTPPHHINRERPREAMWNEASAVGAEWATALRRFGGVGNIGELLQSGATDTTTSSALMARVAGAAAEVTDAVEQGMGGDGFGRVLRRDARGLASVVSRMLAMMVEQLPKARQQWDTWARDCVEQAEARATTQQRDRHKQRRANSARSRPPKAKRPVTALSKRPRNRQFHLAGSVGMAHLARSRACTTFGGARSARPASAPVLREEAALPALRCAERRVQRGPLCTIVNQGANTSGHSVVDDRGTI